ncbi:MULTISPECIES: Coenzyme F420 hydrogenase/dehydrogenase, beta subunit C-terminal domain [unclassified Butyrivibrio]|uniref:Coenzyme F420 hydrogenase/dehydrogenase, beta subunit C-terminal domain n=1 Tax=unclassified Butyrivibrio TaxID=2639466 RepID=UPI00040C42BE|nr:MULTISPECIES: Coenzyme F420 hydrogenase/dehydrogenase, beta subunit C-terminal domain [unclassified Butyrivibrio]
MVILEDITQCYGCGACKNACPVNAIEMELDDEGFLIPKINEDVCISCGKCKSVCIANKAPDLSNDREPYALALTASQDILYECSSGGAFTLLAEYVLSEGGVVYGASFTEDFFVEHIRVENLQELDKLKKSKYAQSNQTDCYSKVKDDLKQGRKVLYTGCSCQIAGLYSYLGNKEDTNLFTMDLICQGVPSAVQLREHLDHEYGLSKIDKVEMRRRKGWGTCMSVFLKNGIAYRFGGRTDLFQLVFHNKLNMRKSCYGCKFAQFPRQGDFTVGDFWNHRKVAKDLEERFHKRTSIVYVNNAHGKELFDKAFDSRKDSFYMAKLEGAPETLNNNAGKPAPSDMASREAFYDLYRKKGFTKAGYEAVYPAFVDRAKAICKYRTLVIVRTFKGIYRKMKKEDSIS